MVTLEQEINEIENEGTRKLLEALFSARRFSQQGTLQDYRTGIKEKSNLIDLLKEQTIKRAREESWAMENTVKYYFNRKMRAHSIADVLHVLERYETAFYEGKKLSLRELTEGTTFSFVEVGRLFKYLKIEPMHGNHKKASYKKMQ